MASGYLQWWWWVPIWDEFAMGVVMGSDGLVVCYSFLDLDFVVVSLARFYGQ